MGTKISFKRNDTYNVNLSESGIRTFLGRIELNTHKSIKGLGRVNNITSEGGMIDIYQRSLLALLDGRYVFRPAKGITPESRTRRRSLTAVMKGRFGRLWTSASGFSGRSGKTWGMNDLL